MGYEINETRINDSKKKLWSVTSFIDGSSALMTKKQLEDYFDTPFKELEKNFGQVGYMDSFEGLPLNEFLSDAEWRALMHRRSKGAPEYVVYMKRPSQKKWVVERRVSWRSDAELLAKNIRKFGDHAMVREVRRKQ